MRKSILIVSLLLLLQSCGETTYKMERREQFIIDVPEYLQETEKINGFASLQFENQEKEIFLLVIEDEKAILQENQPNYSFDNYFSFVTERFTKSNIRKTEEKMINGMFTKQVEAAEMENNRELHYKMAVIEGKEHFYQVITWTSSKNKDSHNPDLQHMIDSFREDRPDDSGSA